MMTVLRVSAMFKIIFEQLLISAGSTKDSKSDPVESEETIWRSAIGNVIEKKFQQRNWLSLEQKIIKFLQISLPISMSGNI